jgi:hypothetical protein
LKVLLPPLHPTLYSSVYSTLHLDFFSIISSTSTASSKPAIEF